MTRGLARDLGPDNIRLNAITPGWIMTQRQIDLWLTPEAEAGLMKAQCLKEKVYPPDIAAHGAVACRRRQPAGDGAELRGRRGPDVTAIGVSLPRRAFRVGSVVVRHALPPVFYFFVAFNLISFTTDLLVHNYWFHLTSSAS